MKNRRRAFSLAELMIALTIFGFASVCLGSLLMSVLKMYLYNTGQLALSAHVRKMTSELSQNAEFASYYVILPDFKARTKVDNSITVLNKVGEGHSGNCLVLVFKDPSDITKVSRVMGYYWVANSGAGDGTLYRFDKIYTNSVTGALWDLMPAEGTILTNPVLIDHVSSSAGVFYNYYGRSIITNCRIAERASNSKNATVTYNFTVSPRG